MPIWKRLVESKTTKLLVDRKTTNLSIRKCPSQSKGEGHNDTFLNIEKLKFSSKIKKKNS